MVKNKKARQFGPCLGFSDLCHSRLVSKLVDFLFQKYVQEFALGAMYTTV